MLLNFFFYYRSDYKTTLYADEDGITTPNSSTECFQPTLPSSALYEPEPWSQHFWDCVQSVCFLLLASGITTKTHIQIVS